MELDELKISWEALTEKLEKQQKLNSKLIEQMINQQYKSRLYKIASPEFIASIFCFMMAIALIWNVKEMDTALLRIFGVLSVLFLIVLPVVSLRSIRGLQSVSMSLPTYADTLKEFARQKIRFQKFQQMNVWLSFIFMVVFTPVSVKLYTGKDISQSVTLWLVFLPVSALVLFFFSRWVLRHYNHTLEKAEELLNDVES